MNANLQLPAPTSIKKWLELASTQLLAIGINSSRLDAELLLSFALKRDRTYLHAHPKELLNKKTLGLANEKLHARLERVPIAYILGYKEFYGRNFVVSNATLIPRPESEEIIESLENLFVSHKLDSNKKLKLIDVGTGSGILGITAKLEFPNIDVTLTDISTDALEIARRNIREYGVTVKIISGDLMENYHTQPDIILANLPYVDPMWDHSTETNYEPASALFAEDGGKSAIKKLLSEAAQKLLRSGFLILESDPCQHADLAQFANQLSMKVVSQKSYVTVIQKS
jgi:release factor glutamine methyltransferase